MLNVRQFQESDVHNIELGYEFTPESRVGLCNHDNIVGYTLVDGEEILAVGGAHVMWFGVGELWVLVSPEANAGLHHLRVIQKVWLILYLKNTNCAGCRQAFMSKIIQL